MALTAAEKQSFVRDGFVAKHFPLDPERVHEAIELAWTHIDKRFERDKPATWVGEIEDSCRVATIAKRRGRVKFRECVRHVPWLVEMIYGRAEILEVIHDLLGPKGGPRSYIRGLYPIFPSPTSSRSLEGGMDNHPFQVCCIIYLTDVERDGGGFTAWAGSHRLMQHGFLGKASCLMLPLKSKELAAQAGRTCAPVEICGPRGTTIFWHHRMLHSPSTNRSQIVRHALVADFLQSDWESKAALPHDENMWADWAVGDNAETLAWRSALDPRTLFVPAPVETSLVPAA